MPMRTPFDDSPLKDFPRGPYNRIEECYFCKKNDSQTYAFQGVPICFECNKKFIDRVKNLLSI